jgi:polyisoprenoid-binding protein YceI
MTYQIDPSHSEVTFQVRHLLSKVRGRFSAFAGTIQFDEAQPTTSKVDFSIDASSVDTNQADRDKHLRSDDFFAAERFPQLTFTSTSVTPRGADAADIAGQLTIRDVTRNVVLPVDFLGKAKDPWGNDRVAFETEITLNRKEYGLLWNAALETGGFLVGDDVKVAIAVQAVPQK